MLNKTVCVSERQVRSVLCPIPFRCGSARRDTQQACALKPAFISPGLAPANDFGEHVYTHNTTLV